MDNVLLLHNELVSQTYKHSGYQAFKINDPKPRQIHKAGVRDRLLHHAVYRILYPFFERTFIADSYSCRLRKGTHRAVNKFSEYAFKASGNNTRTCWVLKCDIKKFFANINHGILINILWEYIPDAKIIWLLENVVRSFSSGRPGIGIPLGNLTSQLFANVYLNKLDQFMKHKLKAGYYIRYVVLPRYRVLRTKTKRRILRKIKQKKLDLSNGKISKESFNQSVQSYLGILKHCKGYKVKKEILLTFEFYPLRLK